MEQSTTPSAALSGGDSGGSAPATTLGDARAALALADSSSAAPAEISTPDTPPAAAIAQPGTEGSIPESGQTEPKTGEPPKWRWQDILENARATSAKEAEERVRKEVESQYSGLNDFAGLSADERAGLAVWHKAMRGDPAARAQVTQAARSNPQLAQALQGFVAPEAKPAADSEPEPDLQAGDGTLVYSAKQQAARDAWMERRWSAKLDERLRPLQNVAQSFQQEKATAAYTTTVSSVIATMSSADPEFAAHKADVSKAIQDDPRLMALALGNGTTAGDPATALELAWGRVHRSKVLPAKQSQSEATVLASLQQRAVAGTTNPASATSATPRQTLGDARAALEHATAQLGA